MWPISVPTSTVKVLLSGFSGMHKMSAGCIKMLRPESMDAYFFPVWWLKITVESVCLLVFWSSTNPVNSSFFTQQLNDNWKWIIPHPYRGNNLIWCFQFICNILWYLHVFLKLYRCFPKVRVSAVQVVYLCLRGGGQVVQAGLAYPPPHLGFRSNSVIS